MNLSAHEERRAALDAAEADTDRLASVLEERARVVDQARKEASIRTWKRIPPSRTLVRTARHEAAHAVAAIASGLEVWGVLALESGAGVCWIEGDADMTAPALAGAIAGRLDGFVHDHPSPADALLVNGSDREVTEVTFAVEDLLDREAGKVDALADRLLEVGFLPGPAVHEIVGRVRLP